MRGDIFGEYNKIPFDKNELIELLSQYQRKFAKEINLNILKEKTSTDYEAFLKVKEEIFNLMEKADILAERFTVIQV